MASLEDCITGGNGSQDGCYKQVTEGEWKEHRMQTL